MTRRVKIAGIGKYLPERVVSNAELENALGLEAGWIARKTGVCERRRIAKGQTQSQMGAAAARAAIADAGAKLTDVDAIISASGCTEQLIPCTAVLMQRELGLAAAGIPCFDVDNTCLSFVHALDIAVHFVECGTYRNVLVISSEVASAGINWDEPESAVLFGDGAAAVLLSRAGDGEASVMYPARFTTDSRGAELAEVKGCGTAHPPNHQDTQREWNSFSMKGPAILKFAIRQSVPFIQSYLATLPFAQSELRALCAHQASLLGLRITARACGFLSEQVLENIATHGNCIAASIPMVLHDGVREGRIRRGDRVLLAGTAAGVSVGLLALVY